MSELKITWHDWLSVFATGLLFSAFLSMLGYYLLKMDIYEGGIFGIVLGFFIALYSLIFVTLMNRYLLPNIPKATWNITAAAFSFASGFLGTISTYLLFLILPISTCGAISYPSYPKCINYRYSYLFDGGIDVPFRQSA